MCRLPLFVVAATGLLIALPGVLSAQTETMMYDHVHLAVPDPQEAAEWYMDHIGGEMVDGRDDRMLLGVTRLIFRQSDGRRPSEGSVIDHLGFSFRDLDAKLQELEAAGASITRPRTVVEGLFPLAFVVDPWGTKLELVEDPQHLGFHHVHLRSPEPEITMQWYLDRFGGVRTLMRGRLDGILYPGNVWLLVTEGETFPSTESTIDHLSWRALNLDEKIEEYREGGTEITLGPVSLSFPNGEISIFFIDGPEDVSIEIVQRAPNMR